MLAAYGNPGILQALGERLPAGLRVVPELKALAGASGECEAIFAHIVGAVPPFFATLRPDVAAKLVLFLEQPSEEDLVELAQHPTPAAIVVKQGVLTADELHVALQQALDATQLGFARYLTGEAPVQRVTLTRSTERGEALQTLDRYTAELALDPRRVAQILTVADELLTNAFYHAPVDSLSRHPYTNKPRIDPVDCRPDRPVELSFCHDARRIAVAVLDLYGSLDPQHVLRHMAKAATNPKANFKASAGSGGARLGLVTAFRATSQLLFNIVPSLRTECVGLIEIGGNYRQFLEGGRSLHVSTVRMPAA